MRENNKLVSVIVPNYNHSIFLSERIESILKQDYRPIEIIILDDSSTDNSLDVIKQYELSINQLIISESNSGNTFVQWNKGINHATGEYIWIAESDDTSDKKFLSTLVDRLEDNINCVIAFSNSYMIDENSKIIGDLDWWVEDLKLDIHRNQIFSGDEFMKKFLSVRNVIMNASSAVFRKEYYNVAVAKNINFKLCGDWYTWIKLAEQGDVIFVSDKLNFYRFHKNTVREKSDRKQHIFIESLKIRIYCFSNFELGNKVKKLIFKETYNNIVNVSISKNLIFKYYNFIKELILIMRVNFKFFSAFAFHLLFKK